MNYVSLSLISSHMNYNSLVLITRLENYICMTSDYKHMNYNPLS